MSGFMQPEKGNVGRLGSPINSARNLVRKLNRQARNRRDAAPTLPDAEERK